jgi:hypothetical protein
MLIQGKTNAAAYELYAVVAEANGRSLPLVFAFVSTGGAATGAKERALQDVLQWVKVKCPHVKFTLSDKDLSEINACSTIFDTAKHQLCYWHAIKYLEERLAEDKPPAAYDSRIAHQQHSFIDPTWAPGVTNGHINEGLQDFTEEDLPDIISVSGTFMFISIDFIYIYAILATSSCLSDVPSPNHHYQTWHRENSYLPSSSEDHCQKSSHLLPQRTPISDC